MSDAIQQAFMVVSGELNKTINQARVMLEDAAEGRSTRQALERCAAHLHEAGGVLKLVEVYGGALLTEEMELVCRFMLERGKDEKTLADCMDALTRAMVQLPAYLERMLAGGRDIALVLLPMLNDLRAVRGQPLLSESTILLLNKMPQASVTVSQRGSDPSEDFAQLSRKIRPAFQLALLGLLKSDGEAAQKHLAKLEKMAIAFEQAAARDDIYRLWWVVAGVLEALRGGALELSVSIKRLLGQADRRIKKVIDGGIASFDAEPVTDLLNSLLYYIARVQEPGPRVSKIREAFALTDGLPGEAQVEGAREELAAPSVALMETVAAAIREDLAAVKDVLDIHVRTGEQDMQKLSPQIDLLSKISDTLGVLGLGEHRQSILDEIDRLQAFIDDAPGASNPDALLAIAATLLQVESTLQRRLTQLVRPKDSGLEVEDDKGADMQGVRKAVMRECIVNLARIKDTLSQTMAGKIDHAAIDSTPMLIDGIVSGFQILELGRAAEVFERLGAFFKVYLSASNHTLASDHQDRLADALVSVEYYMETIEAGRKEPAYMLDNAETCLLVLDDVRAAMLAAQSADGEYGSATLVTAKPDFADDGYSRTATIADESQVIHSPVVTDDTSQIDPELLELFIEEAKDEVTAINRLLPKWQADTADVDSLITVRRSFHTLKGSGRMVGAERIGEYCWHIEDLLNRVINRTLSLTPAMVAFVSEAAAAVPELIEQLEIGVEPKVDIGLLTAKAMAFAEGDPMAAQLSRESVMSGQPALEMDPVLHEIFSKEAGVYLATINAFTGDIEAGAFPVSVSDAMHRACHTLHGSINTASVERAAPLSGALNQMIRRIYDSNAGLDQDGLRLVQRSSEAIASIIASINKPGAKLTNIDELVASVNEKTAAFAHEQTSLLDEADAPQPTYEPTEVLEAVQMPGVGEEVSLAASPDYDPEIAEIFTEEAAEILEGADSALESWSQTRDQESLTELKRLLHTLKGGANMAGISAFGNLSHELEALLIALDDERVAADAGIDNLLRRSFDTLHQMRELVVSGKQPRALPELEGTVRLAALGEPVEIATAVMQVEAVTSKIQPTAAPPAERGFSDEDLVKIPESVEDVDALAAITQDGTQADEDDLMDLGDVFTASVADDTPEDEVVTQTADERPGTDVEDGSFDAFLETDVLPTEPGQAADDDDELFVTGAETVVVDEDTGIVGYDVSETSQADFADETLAYDHPAPSDAYADHDKTVAIGSDEQNREVPAQDNEFEDDSDGLIERSQVLEALIEGAALSFASAQDDSDASADHDEPGDAEIVDEMQADGSDDVDAAPEEAAQDELEDALEDPAVATNVVPMPTPGLPTRDTAREKKEFARVDSRLLENMLNAAGEISIYHGRLAQQVSSIEFHLAELDQTVTRLRDQLRQMDIETEAQILTRHEEERTRADFDPLELDRYSTIQQLSRALAETSSDVDSLRGLLQSVTGEADTLLTQQSRVTAELQSGLMRTRMVPFDRHVARLARLVRQSAADTGKQAELAVEGASGELDRQVLDKMLPPLEHMMRNAVVHGIESTEVRQAAGKPPTGQITIRLHREGSEMVIDVADDGRGLDADAIRRKGVERGLIVAGANPTDEVVMELILEPGFSTAEQLTQAAGRGVGMDVVANEVKRLGGSLRISSMVGQGTNFTIRLPFTLAITQALVVRAGDEVFALPLPTVEGVTRLPRKEVERLLASPDAIYDYGEHSYRLRHLAPLVGGVAGHLADDDHSAVSIILVRAGSHSTALLVDEMLASREIVVKAVGPQIAGITGVSGATILGDGSVVLILDMPSLVRMQQPLISLGEARDEAPLEPLVMVVDDSITVRRVTERFLLRHSFRVITAKDGLDAVSVIQEQQPDVILLDIEMPRMDGFEFATHVRNDPRFAQLPIIMITSRSGEKHKARAIEIGVNDYLGKPYQDHQLLKAIENQLEGSNARKTTGDSA